MKKFNTAVLEVLSSSKEFCCLCFKDEIETVISIEEEILFVETGQYFEIGDLLMKTVDKDIFDVIKLFGTICKTCSTSLINCYKFIQSSKNNYKQLKQTIDSLSNSLQVVDMNSKTVFIDLNTNKQFHSNAVCSNGQEAKVLNTLMKKIDSNDEIKTDNRDKLLFPIQKNLSNHKSNKHDKMKCATCKQFFNSIAEFKSHKHSLKTKYICTVCGKVFYQKRALENHEDRHNGKIMCSNCGRIYKNKDSFRIHIIHNVCSSKSRATPHNGKFICDYCNKKYTQKMSLRTHIQYEHLNYKAHECKYCNKKFWAQSRLKTHVLKHTKEKNFKCTTCGGCFATRETLLYHTRMHTGEKPYECEVCGEKFISSSRRLMHHKKEHLKETFKCQICSLEYTSKYRLQKHIKLKHDQSDIDMIKHLESNIDVDDAQFFEVYDGIELIVGV